MFHAKRIRARPTYLSVDLRPICIKRVYVSTFYAILQALGEQRAQRNKDLLPYLSLFIERAGKANRARGANNRVLAGFSFGSRRFGEWRR